jgi:nucleoside-diphosphate-sugar epimerase
MTDGAVLVTGAAGLIGATLLTRLQAANRAAVGIDRLVRPGQSGVEIADLTDIHRLHDIAARHRVGAVVHCGAVSGPMVMADNPHGIIQANVVGTANIIELARVRRLRRVVFCSSVSAYGPTTAPADGRALTEETPLRPSSVYGATKVASEVLIAGYRRQHGLDAVSIRLSWVYGPGRTTACALRDMIEDARAGRPTRIAFGRDVERQYIHVEDAASALLAALDATVVALPAYTATGGSSLTLGAIAGIVAAAVGGAEIAIGDGADPDDDVQHPFDISAIARDLGYRPRIALADGIRSYAAWLAARA